MFSNLLGEYIAMNAFKFLIATFSITLTAACAFDGKIHRSEADADPFENINRPIFTFNQHADKYVLRPLSEGYRAITTPFVRERINNTLSTIKEPVSAVNHLLQGEPKGAAINISRFVINATLGLAGMFDVANGWGLKADEASMNETLAKWCIVDGPYLVLPLLGPSTPRAATGLAVDSVLNPVYLSTYSDANIRDKINYPYTAIRAVALREKASVLLDDLERNSVDLYAATRSAYLQNQSKLRCFNSTEVETEAYDFDFGIEEEEAAFEESGY